MQYNELGAIPDKEVPGGSGNPAYTAALRTLPGSKAAGSSGSPRLTNLMQLTLDTSWWTRYRSSASNPDLDHFVFPQAIPGLFQGQFPAIPRTDDDLTPAKHLQAIANTAGFHFATIEQGGTSLYPPGAAWGRMKAPPPDARDEPSPTRSRP
ncbi:MAG TPA: hypothetical protein VKX45_00865 [Bryobacteraceae bacterium]|jgi:hypothetical protein|nr:hypothetical protein [Bryobacteraceae bacterium]